MRGHARLALIVLLGSGMLSATGCNSVPRRTLALSQQRAMQLYQQNQALMAERDSQALLSQRLGGENQTLKQQMADLEALRDTLQQRVDNLASEQNSVRDSFTSSKTQLPAEVNRSLQDLETRYPGFEFNPNTGVATVSNDILFASGSADIRPEAMPLLKEVASRLNGPQATELNLLVVGHTDDRQVVKPGTKAKHPDNWYLSAHRAISVREQLERSGIKPARFGIAGYGPFQPKQGVSAKDEAGRAKNRRVEIFIVAPNNDLATNPNLDTIVK